MDTKRIGIVSDTHGPLPEAAFELLRGQWDDERLAEAAVMRYQVAYDNGAPVEVRDRWPEGTVRSMPCDLVLHAGDIGSQSALDDLGAICRTVAVLGNNDRSVFWCSDGEVSDLRALTFAGVDIAMMHIPADLRLALHGRPPTVLPAVERLPQLAVHGHTHIPEVRLDGATLVVCPGSPSQARRGSGHNAALVDVEEGRIERVTIVRLP